MDSSLKILHPDKDEFLRLEDLQNYFTDGFYKIISTKEEKKLTYFLSCFEKYREENNEKITDTALYNNLPFSIQDASWKAKQKDVKIITDLIGNRKQLNILDIGCWNGWLCNYLTKKGHQVVGIDVFTDEFDGLKAKKHYQENFILLQLIPEEIHRIQANFDLIIFNRIWPYFSDGQIIFNHAKKILSKNGIILFTGLSFNQNPKKTIQHLTKVNYQFKLKYDIPILYKPSKGYLDKEDLIFFSKNGIGLLNENKIKNKLTFIIKKISLFYGIYNEFNS